MTLEKLLLLCSFLSLISLLSCYQIPDTNANRPLEFDLGEMVDDPGLFFVDSTDLQCSSFLDLLQAFRISLSSTPAFWVEFTDGWQYAPGDPGNGLRVSWEQKPDLDTIIYLPHRINRPNWPLWYERSLSIREPAYLYVNADDGAQCYLDGILQEPVMGSYFEIEPNADSVLVSLRVLNNALNGGLRSVALIKAADFERFQKEQIAALHVRQLLYLAHLDGGATYNELLDRTASLLTEGDLGALQKLDPKFSILNLPKLPNGLPEPQTDGTFSFSAWGDSQGGWSIFDQIVQQMTEHPDAFSIGLGDLVSEGVEEDQWLAFTQCLQPLLAKRPVFGVAGNHDYDGYYNDLNPLLYRKYVLEGKDRPTYFSWTYGNAFFLALDPNESFPLGINGAQRSWMAAEMDSPEWREASWRFLLIHQPPYAQGWPEYHGDEFIREIVDSLAESKRIDFVLAGHSHDYERLTKDYGSQQTHFFILGGAGGGLEPPESSTYPKMDTIIKAHHYARFEVNREQVTVSVHSPAGELLDIYSVALQRDRE